MMRLVCVPLLMLVAGCGAYPRDTQGTLNRVEQTRLLRVGLANLDPADVDTAKSYIARLERQTGAKAQVTSGGSERLLARLEAGDLDLVLGDFAEDSPWLASVALIEPLTTRTVGERMIGLAPVTANGENRWVALLERTVRDMEERP